MLRVRLIGALEIERNGAVIDSPGSQRPWALFAYLVLAGRPVSRGELASCFWPDVLERSARASLRSALWTLRRALGSALTVDGDRVVLSAEEGLWVDAHEFDRLAASAPEEALTLCRGPLLDGIDHEWALLARQRHRERRLELLEALAQAAVDRGDVAPAVAFTRRQVDLDPLDEQASRRLMERLEASGDAAGALRTYRSLRDRLRRELAVAPSRATRELAERLRAPPLDLGVPPAGSADARPPMVGRASELSRLAATWSKVEVQCGAVAVVRGEAGIGKTRLTTELRNSIRARGGLAAVGGALDLGGAAPLTLWAEIVRELTRAVPAPSASASWPADLAVLIGELPQHFAVGAPSSAAIAPDLLRARLFEAVVALLTWASAQAPVLLVLEDVHSADALSLELAGYVSRRLGELRVLMLLTRRELPRHPGVDRFEQAVSGRGALACEIDLGPLPAPELARLARRAGGLDEEMLTRVVAVADGNPLLALETARALAHGAGGVAPSLRGLARSALVSVGGGTRDLIELLAVAGRWITPGELEAVGDDAVAQTAGPALETGLLGADDGRIGFRHALLRDAVYEELADPRRTALHRRWADALLASQAAGARTAAAEVARHLRLGRADNEAVPQLARAADEARAIGALDDAIGYLDEALSLEPGRADLWLERGELEAWQGRRTEAEVAFDRALALLEHAEPVARARAWLRSARVYHGAICIPRAVLDASRAAIALLERCPSPPAAELSEALAAAAWAEAVAGSVEAAEALLARAANVQGEPEDSQIYDVGHARALALMRRGQFASSYGPSIAAGEAITRAGRPDLAYGCWANAAGAAFAAGEPERALEFIDRGLAALAGQGLESLEVHLLAARAFVLRDQGRLEQARATAEEERSLAERLGQPALVVMSQHDLGQIALAQGAFEEAAELLARALTADGPISRPNTRLGLAEALARMGDPGRAEQELRATVLEPVAPADAPAALVPRLTRVQGVIAQADGRPGDARRRLEEAAGGWQRLLSTAVRAESVTTVLADLGRPVVGLVDPERELARIQAELDALPSGEGGTVDAVVS